MAFSCKGRGFCPSCGTADGGHGGVVGGPGDSSGAGAAVGAVAAVSGAACVRV